MANLPPGITQQTFDSKVTALLGDGTGMSVDQATAEATAFFEQQATSNNAALTVAPSMIPWGTYGRMKQGYQRPDASSGVDQQPTDATYNEQVPGYKEPSKYPDEVSLTDAQGAFWTDPSVRQQVQDMLVRAGKSPDQASGAWDNSVKTSRDLSSRGIHFDPFQVLSMHLGLGDDPLSANLPGAFGSPVAGAGTPTTSRNTNTSNDTTFQKDSAQALDGTIRSAVHELLKRDPTDAELAAFMGKIKAAQATDPITSSRTTTSTSTGTGGANATSNTTSTSTGTTDGGNYDPTQAVRDQIMSGDEYKRTKATGDAMQALFAAIQSPTGL